MLIFICPPVDLEPAILRRDGLREAWARVCLLTPATDYLDGLPLDTGWRVWTNGELFISDASLKSMMMNGLRSTGSHGMIGQLA